MAVQHALLEMPRLGFRQVRVHRQGVDAASSELILLIFHQGDERAHDDSQAFQHQRRQLIDQRFSTTGRHNDKSVMPLERRLDRLPLAPLKIMVAEARDEYFASASPRCIGHENILGTIRSGCRGPSVLSNC